MKPASPAGIRLPVLLPILSLAILALTAAAALGFTPSGLLEIHQINVEQGDCTLIIGPDGTTFLIDAGDTGKGNNEVVPYLQNVVGLMPGDGIDYMLATHRHADHLGGLDEVINAGYDVHVAVWDNGSSYTSGSVSDFLAAAATTSAGAAVEMPVGQIVPLGDGATATAVCVDGYVLGHGSVSGATSDENDRSVAMLIRYKDFDYLTAGDLGGGQDDYACTDRTTTQVNLETPLAVSLMPGGGAGLLGADGVEVIKVNHHGSESSMNSDYMNLLTPAVAVIPVGAGQSSTWHHPRIDVVEGVLLAQASCVTAGPALVLQTEEGAPTGTYTSYAGYCCGDIAITTTGTGSFAVDATGDVSQGPDERAAAGLPAVIAMDGGAAGPPVAAFTGSPTSGTAPLEVAFTDQSSGDITSWSWDFGDLGTSSEQHPVHTYADAGIYTVVLTVVGPGGEDTLTRTDYITATEDAGPVVALASDETTVGGTVTGDFTATFASDDVHEAITEQAYGGHPVKTYSYLEHRWDFSLPGGSTVTFHVEAHRPANPDGDDFAFEWSTDGAIWTPLVTVAATADQAYAAGMPAGLSGPVTVRVVDTDRSWGATSNDAVYVDELYIEVLGSGPQPPVADFAGSPTAGALPLTVDFTDLSTGTPTAWTWDFGDGSGGSSEQNPSHTYTSAGDYTVVLTATNEYGQDTETKLDYVSVTESGSTMHVAGIAVSRQKSGAEYVGVGVVTVRDELGGPVAGATVFATATGPVGGTFSGPTGADGTVTFQTGGMKKPSGEWCFEVTDVTHAGLTYAPGDNLATLACESGVVYGIGAGRRPAATGEIAVEIRPNPFNPATEIRFALPAEAPVRLEIYNVAGQRVAVLLDGICGAGPHAVRWEATRRPSGIYFLRLTAGDRVATGKLMLLK